MKAILEFDLPDEQEEFKLAHDGNKIFCCMWDLVNFIRMERDRDADGKTADEALQAVWDFIWNETDWNKYED